MWGAATSRYDGSMNNHVMKCDIGIGCLEVASVRDGRGGWPLAASPSAGHGACGMPSTKDRASSEPRTRPTVSKSVMSVSEITDEARGHAHIISFSIWRIGLSGLVVWMLSLTWPAVAQDRMMDDEAAIVLSKRVIQKMYNWEHDSARVLLKRLEVLWPDHPSVPFSKAMVFFWESFPTQPGSESLASQEELLQKSVGLAERRLADDPHDHEGVFFKMVAKGVLIRHYREYGDLARAVGESRDIYPMMMTALDSVGSLVEYKTPAGIYNYYRDYFPQQEPSLRPLMMFFRKGGRELGLRQLVEASQETIFTRPEAIYYLCYIYNWYERNPEIALKYIGQLCADYPRNLAFTALKAEILLQMKQYKTARVEVHKLAGQEGASPYFSMLAHAYEGLIKEKLDHDLEAAYLSYQKAEEILVDYSRFSYSVKPFIYMGYAHYYGQIKKDKKAANGYRRKAQLADKTQLIQSFGLE